MELTHASQRSALDGYHHVRRRVRERGIALYKQHYVGRHARLGGQGHGPTGLTTHFHSLSLRDGVPVAPRQLCHAGPRHAGIIPRDRGDMTVLELIHLLFVGACR